MLHGNVQQVINKGSLRVQEHKESMLGDEVKHSYVTLYGRGGRCFASHHLNIGGGSNNVNVDGESEHQFIPVVVIIIKGLAMHVGRARYNSRPHQVGGYDITCMHAHTHTHPHMY